MHIEVWLGMFLAATFHSRVSLVEKESRSKKPLAPLI